MSETPSDILVQLREAMDSWAGEINETRALMLSNNHSDTITKHPVFEAKQPEATKPTDHSIADLSDALVALRQSQHAIKERDKVIALSRERITEMQSLMGALRDELQGLRAAVRKGRLEQERLEFERRKTKDALEELLRRYRALESTPETSAHLEADKARLNQELEFAREQLTVLNGRIQEAQDELALYASRYDETARSLGRSRLTQERLFHQVEERNAAHQLLRRDRDRLERELQELQQQHLDPDSLARIVEVSEQGKSLGETEMQALDELKKLAMDTGSMMSRLDEARGEWEAIDDDLKETLGSMAAARDWAIEETRKSRSGAASIEKELAASREACELLEARVRELDMGSEQAREETERFAVINQRLTEEVMELRQMSRNGESKPSEITKKEAPFGAVLLDEDTTESQSGEGLELPRTVEDPVAAAEALLATVGKRIADARNDSDPKLETGTDENMGTTANRHETESESGRLELHEAQRLISSLQQQISQHERTEQTYRREVETLREALDTTSIQLVDARGELEATHQIEDGRPLEQPVEEVGIAPTSGEAIDAEPSGPTVEYAGIFQPNRALQEEVEQIFVGRARRFRFLGGLSLVGLGLVGTLLTIVSAVASDLELFELITGAGGRFSFLGLHQLGLIAGFFMVLVGALLVGFDGRKKM